MLSGSRAFLLISLLGLCCGSASAQTLKDETRLLDKPSGSPQGPALTAGTAVKVLERQGFWLRVEGSGKSGWLKASSLSFSSGSSGPTAIDTGRMGTGNIVATSAARGLSAKDLMSGSPRRDEVEKLTRLSIGDSNDISAFMAQGLVTPLPQRITMRTPELRRAEGSAANTGPNGAGVASSKPKGKKNDDDW